MSTVKLYSFIFLITLLFVNMGVAQYQFEHYNQTHGLPLDEIIVIKEDSLGYIWMGGPSGLSRFDGANYTHYIKGKLGHNVAGNIVNDIDVISKDKILITYDDNGVSIYDHKSDTFESREYHNEDSDQFPMHSIFSSYIVNDSTALLCCNREGLFRLNLRTLRSEKLEIGKLPKEIIKHPFEENKFLFTARGLWELDIQTLDIKRLTKVGTSGLKIIDDNVWFNGYTHLILKYNIKTKELEEYESNFRGVVRGWTMVNGKIWVGLAEGVEVIDTTSKQVVQSLTTETGNSNFSGDFIYEVYKDSKERVWVASNKGLNMYNPKVPTFRPVSFLPDQSTFLDKPSETTFLSMDFYNNLVQFIDENKVLHNVKIKGDLKEPVHTLHYEDKLLVVFYNGIGIFDLEKLEVRPYASPFTTANRRGLNEVLMAEDNMVGIYWYDSTIVNWDVKGGSIDTVKIAGGPKTIMDTQDGYVWVSGFGFLCRIDLHTRESQHISLVENHYDELAGVIEKIERADSSYWVSTRIKGIWKVSFDNGEFEVLKQYSVDQGLNNNLVDSYTDEEGHLYVQSRAGLSRFDSESDRFVDIGQPRNLFLQNLFYVSVWESILYVSGHKNFSFDLSQLDNDQEEPIPYLKKILVNGEPIDISKENLSLNYNENTISIACDVVYYDRPSKLKTRYRLSPYDSWVYPSRNNQVIHFASLAAGLYDFEFSASNGNGIWSTAIKKSFEIRPPFWKSWWFLILIFSLLGCISFLIYRIRLRQIGKMHAMSLQLAELESESLRAQMNPHFVFNALNSIKSYIIKNDKENAADYLTTFSELIRAVLRNSIEKEISLEKELEALRLYLQIENLRLDNKFEFDIIVEDSIDSSQVAFPPLIIQPFVENSIWHGFINKKTQGYLQVNIKKVENDLIVIIEDDGIGREASKKIEIARSRKRSYGIAITQTRLQNIMEHADIHIEDLYHDGHSTGTRVSIRLPFRLIDNNSQNER